MKLDRSFYQRSDVVQISRDLLGKVLCTKVERQFTSAKIVETEAYSGVNDRACHAHLGRFTRRTAVMYEGGGVAYVYLCYGIHNLFNVVTNEEGIADAVLIRAVEPLEGVDIMLNRRGKRCRQNRVTAGPGSLTRAMGIDRSHYGLPLTGDIVWIEEAESIPTKEIISDIRVGVDYALEDALKPWRFYISGNSHVSQKRAKSKFQT